MHSRPKSRVWVTPAVAGRPTLHAHTHVWHVTPVYHPPYEGLWLHARPRAHWTPCTRINLAQVLYSRHEQGYAGPVAHTSVPLSTLTGSLRRFMHMQPDSAAKSPVRLPREAAAPL